MSSAGGTPRQRRAVELARLRLASRDPHTTADCAGVDYTGEAQSGGWFTFEMIHRALRVCYPGAQAEPVDEGKPIGHAQRLLALHYLAHADGHALENRWVAFRELPDGLTYSSAFRGRVEPPLLATFGEQPERFRTVARKLNGSSLAFGDVAYSFQVLPRVPMAIIIYLGDEEFSPSVGVLYDGASGHYLPTEDLAILGGMFVGNLLGLANR